MEGTAIVRVRYWRKVNEYAEPNWEPYVAVGPDAVVDACSLDSQGTCVTGADDWYAYDSDPDLDRTAYRDLSGISTTSFVVGLRCLPNVNHICGNGDSINRALAQVFSAFFTIADPTPPSVGAPSGAGWTAEGWQQGTLPLALSSSDATGIYATRVYADGSLLAVLQGNCHYDRPRPCTDEGTGDVGLPTADLLDGVHTIELAAVDAAGNETRLTRPAPLAVDNHPPAAPVGLAAAASTSATNDFSLSWSLPADGGTPIVGARYQVCWFDGCGAVHDSAQTTGIADLQVPAAGSYDVHVWLADKLGHESPDDAATIRLVYDPPPTPTTDTTSSPTTSTNSAPSQAPPPIFGPPTPSPSQPVSPMQPTAKASPRLRITTFRRVGRLLTVAGSLSRKASGRVTISYRVRPPHSHRTLSVVRRGAIRRGAFSLRFALPPSVARARRATLVVAYPGNATTARAARIIAIRAAR